MNRVEGKTFDQERALYGWCNTRVEHCTFDGPADGESALKECSGVQIDHCFFNLRYPLWHNQGLKMEHSELTENCRAALWYSDDVEIAHTRLHGIKALRECARVRIYDCNILSPEFGWSVSGIEMQNCDAQSEYFMMRSDHLNFCNVHMKGKYSFQYVEDSVFDHCVFDTKDAFWHAKNVVVRNSVVQGEYLAWYCENVTFENCRIVGTQPLCYCKNLKLIGCEMAGADLCFERSEVDAVITTPVISIKNPLSGRIVVPAVGEVIRDITQAKGEVVLQPTGSCKGPNQPVVCA